MTSGHRPLANQAPQSRTDRSAETHLVLHMSIDARAAAASLRALLRLYQTPEDALLQLSDDELALNRMALEMLNQIEPTNAA